MRVKPRVFYSPPPRRRINFLLLFFIAWNVVLGGMVIYLAREVFRLMTIALTNQTVLKWLINLLMQAGEGTQL
jgi:hypothetical protein